MQKAHRDGRHAEGAQAGRRLAHPLLVERCLDVAFGPVDWASPIALTFEPPDREVFACLDLAYRAGRTGGGAPAWLNAANEVAVAAFLSGRLGWLAIAEVVADTLESFDDQPIDSFEAVLEADRLARARAELAVEKRGGSS